MNLSNCNKEDLKKSGIYKISNTINEKFYIGSAVNFNNRIRLHKSNFNKQKHNNHFQNFVNKYGIDTLVFEIIELVLDIDNLLIREQCYLDLLKPYLKEVGFNISPLAGSTLGVKMPQSHKDATSERMKGKQYRLGQKATEDTKLLISENSIKFWAENPDKKKEMGNKISKLKKGVPQWVDKPHPNLGKESPCKGQKRDTEFCENLSKRMTENNPMKGKPVSAKRKEQQSIRLSKPVYQIDNENNIIKEFKSCKEAQLHLGLSKGSVSRVCDKIYKHTKNLYFKWAN